MRGKRGVVQFALGLVVLFIVVVVVAIAWRVGTGFGTGG